MPRLLEAEVQAGPFPEVGLNFDPGIKNRELLEAPTVSARASINNLAKVLYAHR